jgi:YggT family protein
MDVITGPIISILLIALDLYMWVVIIGVILSWLVAFSVVNTSNRFVYMVGDFCYRATEPILGRIRGILPNLGGLDVSPVVLILGIIFLKEFLIRLAHKIV